jgi:flagellar basal body-associated protein FliL
LAWFDDPIIVLAVAIVMAIACSTVIFAMYRNRKKTSTIKAPQTQTPPQTQPQTQTPPQTQTQSQPQPQTQPQTQSSAVDLQYTSRSMAVPFRLSKSVQGTMASNAKDELRMLDLEREILGDAIRRLYEAQAEGKITEVEREKLAGSYKQRMNIIKDSIAKDESIIALHELEGMQEDLMKLFSERFGELTSKVEELRTRIDVKPIREIPIRSIPTTSIHMVDVEDDEEEEEEEEISSVTKSSERKPVVVKKRKPPEEKPTAKTEAERRIESIRSEVEKVLDKLGQMEIEG